jgi:hypothetical protein
MFSVQFHPHAASVIATAGFDRVVRIWSEIDNSLDMTVVQVKKTQSAFETLSVSSIKNM